MNALNSRFDDVLELTCVVPEPRKIITLARAIDFALAFLLAFACL